MRNGLPGKPITIRAVNDGKVVIDGQGRWEPVKLGEHWPGPVGDYYAIEGIVARNGTQAAVLLYGHNNVLRRVSAYDADPDSNPAVIWIIGDGNLLEDTIAAGTGRYMYSVRGSGNTIRRAFAMYGRWDGRKFCGVQWPHGYGFGVYNASDNTLENVISYGLAPNAGVMVQTNGETAVSNNNAILGSMALLSGRERDGSISTYGTGLAQPTTRPGPTDCTIVTDWGWGGQRVGFLLWVHGETRDNVFRDVLATGNVGLGFYAASPVGATPAGTVLDHATLAGNGARLEPWEANQGRNIWLGVGGVTVTNSVIAGASFPRGEGARLDVRYVDRVRTSDPLWPWAMETRAQAELGISVTDIAARYIAEGAQ